MSTTALGILLALVALVALLALLLGGLALRRQSGRPRSDAPLPTDVAGLREVVEHLREESAAGLRRPQVVRYDAFGDMGGRLSWSVALLDAQGDGVVLTSIHGRNEARTYAKTVSAWVSEQQLSEEEADAVALARRG